MRFSWIFVVPIVGILSSCLKDNAVVDQTGPQYIKDTIAISAYIKQNNVAATKLPQGIWFIIDSLGNGIRGTFSDSVKIKYSKRLLADNSLVEQSTTPKHFVMDSLMLGVADALPQFPVGSKGRIFIPSFFTNGLGVLYTTSNVVFEFKLAEVKDYQLKLDTTAIDKYLDTHAVTAERDVSGLRYTIDTLKPGTTPRLTDEVQVNYLVKNLSDGAILDQGTSVSFDLSTLILGWQIGLRKITEGSTCTLYLPSSLCYGRSGNGETIKANTNLIFTIKLLKVIHR